MSKPIITALPRLLPVQIVNLKTGELHTWESYQAEAIDPLLGWVVKETKRLFEQESARVLADAEGLHHNPAEYARQKQYNPDIEGLGREVKAKSRLARLVRHKLMSETASYVRNPNPRKQPHKFSRTINLGAVDSQMVTLSREDEKLVLTWKCWEAEYELIFLIPHYAQSRPITKWSLPVVGGRGFVFSYQEVPVPVFGDRVAGVDLGRVEPFTLAILGDTGSLEAEYRARPQVRQTNRKRERILQEVKFTRVKAKQYDALGLDSSILRQEIARKRSKASRIGQALNGQIAANITNKLTKHEVSILHIENLAWVQGVKYGSRWNHGAITQKIEHTNARHGVRTKRVNPKNTSQSCHKCGTQITHNTKTRTVWCGDCKLKLDRDVNAALNIAKNKKGIPLPLAGNADHDAPTILVGTMNLPAKTGKSPAVIVT